MCINLHQPGSVGEGGDHLQLIKNFGPPALQGRGSASGQKNLLAPPYHSQLAVFASPMSAFFIVSVMCLSLAL